MPITRDSHYVPQATIRRWSDDGTHVWAYRLLVSHETVPNWERKAIKGLACQDDIYTTFHGDQETDEFERFITSIEEPAQLAIENLLAHGRMKPSDWKAAAAFVAAQQLRTPLYFLESSRRAERNIQESLEGLIREYEEAGAIFKSGDGPAPVNFLRDSLRITIEHPTDGSNKAAVRAETKSPRSVWMDTQRHHLTRNLHHITRHRWRAASPFGDEEWPLTDHPVLTLNYYGRGKYDFDAGWGKQGSEFILPVSPKVALYTQVGNNATGRFAFSQELTEELQLIMATRAFRWILASHALPWVSEVRPREVNAQRFEQERQFWREWNHAQGKAESEFQPTPGPTLG